MAATSERPVKPAAAAPEGERAADLRFSYKGWEVQVQLDCRSPEGRVAGHADIRAGSYTCRLMRAGQLGDDGMAIEILAQKARELIDDRHALAVQSRRDAG